MPSEEPLSYLLIAVPEEVVRLLAVLDDGTELPPNTSDETKAVRVIQQLVDHAQQGVYRPGSWERGWIAQVFGDEWREKLERDPTRPMFDRPKEVRAT